MKTLILIPTIFISFRLSAQTFEKQNGKGTLVLNTGEIDAIVKLYAKQEDTIPTFELSFFIKDDSEKDIADYYYKFNTGNEDTFIPLHFYKPEDGGPYQLTFIYFEEKNGKIKIALNNGGEQKYYWLKTNSKIVKQSWLQFYQTMCSVENENHTTIVFNEPKSNSTIIFDEQKSNLSVADYHIKPISIKGYWMEVKIERNEVGKKPKKGWIIWRNDKEILITYNRLCC